MYPSTNLDIFAAVEYDFVGLHVSVVHVDLVADKDNRKGLAHPDKIAIP